MVPVLKKSTGKARIRVDLKRLNVAVKREQYTLPVTDEIIAKLSGATVFLSLDAASVFFPDSTASRQLQAHYLYHAVWQISLQEAPFRNNERSGNFPEKDDGDNAGARRGRDIYG